MDKKKLRQCAEGLIVTAAGLGYVLLSLGIRRNPVKTDGFWGLLTEAKFLPLLLSAMLTLQGVRLTAALWKGQEVSAGGHSITKRSVSVVLKIASLKRDSRQSRHAHKKGLSVLAKNTPLYNCSAEAT